MKIERLYAITIYLLNHGKTSASKLADHFEVISPEKIRKRLLTAAREIVDLYQEI